MSGRDSLWHPTSALFLVDPACMASRELLRMFLRTAPALELRVVGDRMWPAIVDGTTVTVRAYRSETLELGDCVVAAMEGYPEIGRVARIDPASGAIELRADADPEPLGSVTPDAVLALVDVPPSGSGARRARWRRRWLDLVEAWRQSPDRAEDRAATVHDKYDYQAQFYARSSMSTQPSLLARVTDGHASAASVLVVGSGVGTEANDLAGAGHEVIGIDFSQAMVDHSVQLAKERGLGTRFEQADIRSYDPGSTRFDTILITYDVYSFIPGRRARVEVLRAMRSWLTPQGRVLVSARLVTDPYSRALLWVSRIARRAAGAEPGDSHTRWIASDGALRRSYVHLFRPAELEGELREAGFRATDRAGGHTTAIPAG